MNVRKLALGGVLGVLSLFVPVSASAAISPTAFSDYARAVVAEVCRTAGVTNEVPGLVPICFRRAADRLKRDYPLQPLGRLRVGVWGRVHRCEALRSRPLDTWQLRVACVKGELDGLEMLEAAAREKGFKLAATDYPSQEEARKAVFSGTVDGLLMAVREAEAPQGLVSLLDLGSFPCYFALPAGASEFPALDAAFTQLKVHSQDLLDALALRYLHVKPRENRVRLAVPIRTGLAEETPTGNLRGSVVEFIQRVARLDDWSPEIIRCRSYGEAKDYARTGAVDVLCGVQLSDDPQLCYTHSFLGYIRNHLLAHPGSSFVREGITTWTKATIAVMGSSASSSQLQRELADYGITAELVRYPSERESLAAFDSGKCDLVLTTDVHASPDRITVYVPQPVPYYFSTSVARRDLRRRIDAVLVRLFREEPFISQKLDRKYFGAPTGYGCVPTIRERQFIADWKAVGTRLEMSFNGLSSLPADLSDLKRANVVLSEMLSELLSSRIGLPVRLTEGTGSPDDAVANAWILDHLWKSTAGDVQETIRLSLRFEHDDECVSLVTKALGSISDDEMRGIVYRVIAECQPRSYMTRDQVVTIIAGILLLSFVWAVYAYRRIRVALGKAERAAHAKTQFLATISHEIRTPLNAIIGFSEHLGDGAGGATTVQDCVQGIRKSSDALLSLINDVLDLTKLEAGRSNLRTGTCDLGKIFAEDAFVFCERARLKGIAFDVAAPEAIPDFELFGPALRQVLTNIVGNAFKYTDKGRIGLSLKIEPQPLGTFTIVFCVKDTGCGISEEGLKKVFDPFSRDIAGQGGRIYEGTGLGLPIVKRLVDALKGEIRIESRLGAGTEVTIVIPTVVMKAPAHPWRPAVAPARHDTVSAVNLFEKLTVAVVDDVSMNRKILQLHLTRAGVRVVRTYGDAREALKELGERPVDLLLTDLWMPELTGEQLAKRCRMEPQLQRMRIVAVSADTDAGATFDISAFDALMPKPVTFEGVKKCLKETLAASRT